MVCKIAEEIRGLINGHNFMHDGVSSRITVSVGINVFRPSQTTFDALDTFVSDTTDALNRAKCSGFSGVSSACNV